MQKILFAVLSVETRAFGERLEFSQAASIDEAKALLEERQKKEPNGDGHSLSVYEGVKIDGQIYLLASDFFNKKVVYCDSRYAAY